MGYVVPLAAWRRDGCGMEPEVEVGSAGLRFLLGEMKWGDQAGRVNPGSWTGKRNDQLGEEVLRVSWAKHPREGNPAGLGCQTCHPVADPEAEEEKMDEPPRPCAPLTRVPSA